MINNGGKGQGGNIIGWLAFVTRKTEDSAGQVLVIGSGGGDADIAVVAFGRYIDSKLWRSPMRLA